MFTSLRALGGVNPAHKVIPVTGRQILKEAPGFWTCLQCLREIFRQVRNGRRPRVRLGSWRRSESCRSQQSGSFKFSPALAIDCRPLTRGLSRSELARVAIFIEAFDQAIDPSEAERLAHRIFIRNALHGCVLFMEYEPHAWACSMVFLQPFSPLLAVANLEQNEIGRHSTSFGKPRRRCERGSRGRAYR